MNATQLVRKILQACSLIVVLQPVQALAQPDPGASKGSPQHATERDGQHDFDFEIGTWKTHLSRLVHPLTGSTNWIQLDGTSVIRKVWDGRADLVELEVESPTGRIEGLSLRLYNRQARQWSLNFSNSDGGTLSQPRRVFRSGSTEWQNHSCAQCIRGHHCRLIPF